MKHPVVFPEKIHKSGNLPFFPVLENEIVFPQVAVKDKGIYEISCRSEAGEGSASFVLDVKGNNFNSSMISHLTHTLSINLLL